MGSIKCPPPAPRGYATDPIVDATYAHAARHNRSESGWVSPLRCLCKPILSGFKGLGEQAVPLSRTAIGRICKTHRGAKCGQSLGKTFRPEWIFHRQRHDEAAGGPFGGVPNSRR